jgi:hypothetical protein
MYYDWKLGIIDAEHRFLRQTLAYNKVWIYYVATAINPILRFSWILYAVVPVQHQRWIFVAFGVTAGEVLRRGVWLLVGVESKYCDRFGCHPPCATAVLPCSREEHAEKDGINEHESILSPGWSEMPALHVEAASNKGSLQPGAIWQNRDQWILVPVPDKPAHIYRIWYK